MAVEPVERIRHLVCYKSVETRVRVITYIISTAEDNLRIAQVCNSVEEITVREIRVDIRIAFRPGFFRKIVVFKRSYGLGITCSLIINSVHTNMEQFILRGAFNDVAARCSGTRPFLLVVVQAQKRFAVFVDK